MAQTADQNAIEVAKKYAQAVKNQGIPVVKTYLFGSRGKNQARPDSDYDICVVVSKSFRNDRWDEAVELQKLTGQFAEYIEPHLLYESDFEDKYDTLVQEIKTTGILV